MYVIWHDNDYDFAKWVYENSVLKDKDVILKSIPKTNNTDLILEKFSHATDFQILPIIKLASPDIIIQKIEADAAKILFVSEFMTHTPQHDHVFQRFERIYCSSKERIPTALILAGNKTKFEKGKREGYVEVKYRPNPLAVHTYLKTTLINKCPTLMFFWPDENGYLKYDASHQTAPKIEGDIQKWFVYLNEAISCEKPEDLLKKPIVRMQIAFLEIKYPLGKVPFYSVNHANFVSKFNSYYDLDRVKIIKTSEAVSLFQLDKRKLNPLFLLREKSVIFEYDSQEFRTDPYCGYVCAYTNLFCIDDTGIKTLNLIHVPRGIKFQEVSKQTKKKDPCFTQFYDDLNKCPIHSLQTFNKTRFNEVKDHLKECIYTKSKQQRIFGTVPDIIVFDDMIYYVGCVDK